MSHHSAERAPPRHVARCARAETRHRTPRHLVAPRPAAAAAMLRCAAAITLLCAALALPNTEKRAAKSPAPFVMGSRYGRSSPGRVMAPRNDRFFLGSRYGKRAGDLPSDGPARLLPTREHSRTADRQQQECHPRLLCEYTGLLSLFKCTRPHNQLEFTRRSDEDTGPGEQQ